MDIRLIDRRGQAHDELAEHARRRLSYRLMHRSDRIGHVLVKLGETGGHRGQRDVYCLMQVQLHNAQSATVVDIGVDPHETIDRAADRVCRLTEEQLRLAQGH